MSKQKALKVVDTVLTVLILLFTVCIMAFTIISVNTVNKENSILGYRPFIVLSNSMDGVFSAGDMIVSKQVEDPQSLQPGDIITFSSIDPNNYGGIVTHQIRGVTTYNGETAYQTYGVATGVDDAYPVPADNVMGQYAFHLPKMGYFFNFLKTPAGYVTVILIPFLLLILLQGIRFVRLFRQYKREQQAEIDAQMAEAAAEKEKARRMMEELQELRSQLNQKDQIPPNMSIYTRPDPNKPEAGQLNGKQGKE